MNINAYGYLLSSSILLHFVLCPLHYCGARVGETISIKNEDINLEKGFVVLKKTKNRTHRFIPLNDTMKSVFSTYVHYRNMLPIKDISWMDGYFFTNHRGDRITTSTVYGYCTNRCPINDCVYLWKECLLDLSLTKEQISKTGRG